MLFDQKILLESANAIFLNSGVVALQLLGTRMYSSPLMFRMVLVHQLGIRSLSKVETIK